MNDKIILGVSIAAIIIATISVATVTVYDNDALADSDNTSQIRDVYLFSTVNDNIDEDTLGIPPDMFSTKTIVVNQGDKVRIHFYNLEPKESNEKHNFTIEGNDYNINEDVDAGENKLIEFTATKSGVFDYICIHHPPTMRGQLVVLPN